MNKRLCQIKSDNGFLDYSSSTPILKGISKEKKEKREKKLAVEDEMTELFIYWQQTNEKDGTLEFMKARDDGHMVALKIKQMNDKEMRL